MKSKLITALKSRTVWTVVILFLINGIQGIDAFTPEAFDTIANPVLSLLAIYFRVSPKA